jgi:ABC-type transporter Mla subunit MlaD
MPVKAALTATVESIETNLDDLQSCVDAANRVAETLATDVTSVNRLFASHKQHESISGNLVKQAKALTSCVRDQREALSELRHSVARLQQELKALLAAAKQP